MSFVVAALGALGVLLVYDGIAGGRREARNGYRARLESLASESGVRNLTAARLVGFSFGAACAGAFVTAGLTGTGVVALAGGLASGGAPVAYARARRNRRRRGFREAWPDAIATLIASVRAGVSLPEACTALLTRGPDQLRPGFEAFASSYRATGSFHAGLARLRAELADPIADRVALALALAHDVGGTDLVRVLRTLGDFVREDLRVRKEIESRWSWTVTAARVAAAAPWVVLVMMSLRPEAAAAYDSPSGAAVIIAGAAATVLGYRLMLRAARLPEDSRIGA
jgi:tight adherence protein B